DITTPNGCGANTANKGGAIYNEHELSIKNWAARNNSASDGGGIYTTSNINLDGKIIITGNTKDESANNLLFTENVRLVIKEGFSDSEIGVTAGFDTGVDSYTFTDGYNKAGKTEVAYFTADAINEAIVLSNSNPKELQIHTYQPNTITGADMTIAESLSFRFSIRLGDMIDKDSAYIAVKGPNDAEPRRVELTPDSTGICVVPCSLYARQFDSEIKYMLADKNGPQKMVMGTTAYDYYCITANQYLTALKEGDYSEEAKKLADAMLVYGAFAEKYFASSDEDTRVSAIAELANNKLNFNSATRGLNVYSNIDTDAFSSYKPGVYQGTGSDTVGIRGEKAGLGHNIGYDSISLVAKDKIALRLYFHGDITNADFEIFRTKMSGRSLSDGQTGDITDYVVGQDHGLYYIEIPDIAAYDLGTYIYVEFLTHYNGGSASQPTFNNPKRALAYGIEVNPLSYAYAVMCVHGGSFKGHSDVYISKALLRYYEDAKAYKEATNQ
ncbi:MAG: hypothetical protein IKH76_03420, partial [Clostridiales bacterium]|nr:hypothetical protein [Clostridiales bacterium]